MSRLFIVIISLSFIVGCSVMRDVGKSLEEWGEGSDNIIGKGAVIAGGVYQSVGCLGEGEKDPECRDKK